MINTVGGMKQVLDNYSAQDWAKSAAIKENSHHQNLIELNPSVGSSSDPSKITSNRTFGDFLFESIAKVNDIQKDANVAMEKLATGKNTNIHETMLIVEQAELAYKTMNQIRMKVLDAYREIMKIQI